MVARDSEPVLPLAVQCCLQLTQLSFSSGRTFLIGLKLLNLL